MMTQPDSISDEQGVPAGGSVAPPTRRRTSLFIALPLVLAIVASLVSFLVASTFPKQYRAQTTLLFPSTGDTGASSIISAINGLGQGGVDKGGSVGLLYGLLTSPQIGSGPNTSIAVMSSDTCRERVVQLCDLAEYWHLSKANAKHRLESIVNIGINKNGLLAVEAVDTDPVKAVQITNAYISTLKSLATELSVNPSRRNRLFIEKRLAVLQNHLNREELQLVGVKRRSSQNFTGTSEAPKLVDTYADLESQLNLAQIDLAAVDARIEWNQHVAQLTARSGANLPATVPAALEARSQLRRLESQLAVAQATLGPDNPQYRLLKLQVQSARAQANVEVAREVRALRNGVAPQTTALYASKLSLEARRDGIQSALKLLHSRLNAAPSAAMQEGRLTESIKNDTMILAFLKEEAEKARLAEMRDASTFEVIDPAEVPTEPFAPRKAYIALFACVAGFLIGVAILIGMRIIKQPASAVIAS